MKNSDPFANRVIDSSDIIISKDDEATLLKVYSPAFYWEFYVFIFIPVVICFIVTTVGAEGMLPLVMSAIVLMFIFVFGFMKRTMLSVFDLSKGVLFHHQSGIYSTNLDAGDQEIKLTDIRHVGIQKHIRRYGDTFQVFLATKTSSALGVTTTNLSFADAQLCAEAIREFLGIQEKIKAVD